MLVSTVLATIISILDDPTNTFWSTTELIDYLNTFMLDLSGIRRDIYSQNVTQQLMPGSYQQVPSGGIQFLESYFAANGQAVFLLNIDDVKHSQFAASLVAAPSLYPQVACADPRDRKGYWVFPASTGAAGSTLQHLYGATPPPVAATTDTYPLDPDTLSGATNYVLACAFNKNTERRDVMKGSYYMQAYLQWAQSNLQAQSSDQSREP